MRAIFALPLVIAIFSSILFVQLAESGSSTANIGANVIVPSACPFAVNVALQSAYSQALGTVVGNYFVFTMNSCTLQPMSGFVNITYTNGVVINSLPVNSGTLTNTPSAFTFNIDLSSLSNTVYDANVGFSGSVAQNFTVQQFQVLSPQNVLVTGFTGSSQINVGAQQSFLFTLSNDGQLASGPITVNVVVTGPSNTVLTASEGSLAPGQSTNDILSTSDASAVAGSYTATITGNYFVNNVNTFTNSQTFSYSVVTPSPPPPSGGGGVPTGVSPITVPSNLQLLAVPLFISSAQNGSVLSQLSIKNSAGVKEVVNLTVAPQFAPYVMLSASSVSIQPGQSVSISVLFSTQTNSTASLAPPSFSLAEALQGSSKQLPPGTYIIPVQITINAGSTTSTQTEYFTFVVTATPQGQPSVLNQINMVNGTSAVSGQIKIMNTYQYNLTNVTLDTLLPIGVAKNASDITAYGIASKVYSTGQNYVIEWDIDNLPPGQILYGYYNIRNPQNQILLRHIQSLFSAPTQPSPSSIIRILDLSIPAFYTSSNGNIHATVLYTGANPQNTTLIMTGPTRDSIANPVQIFYAVPNQVIDASFNVTTSSQAGTDLFTLSVSTSGANQTYSLPVLVLSEPSAPSSTTTVPQSILGSLSIPLPFDGLGIIALIIVVIVILKLRSVLNRPKYSPDRSDRLIRMKNRIERSDKDDRVG